MGNLCASQQKTECTNCAVRPMKISGKVMELENKEDKLFAKIFEILMNKVPNYLQNSQGLQKDILTEYTKNPKIFEDSLEPKEINMLLDYIDEVTSEPKPE